MSTVVCTHGFGCCWVGTLYMGGILLRTRYIWGAGVRFFPGCEGGGVALDGVRG